MSDEEIVQGLKNGDDRCFMILVESYRKKLISLCYSYTRDYQEAEDLSQEVFISIYKSVNSFRGDCTFATFLYKVAVSRCLDHKRKRSIKDFLTGIIMQQPAVEQDPDEKSFIRECIKSMKEEHRLPIILQYYIGLEQKEIAQILGVSQKAVEGRIYRAKQILKKKIEEGGYEGCSREMVI